MSSSITRQEHDLIGDREVPDRAYYGVHTVRALENFPISGIPISRHPDLVVALAIVKSACALANRDLGQLSEAKTAAITEACADILAGDLHDQFVVDVMQGGAGTSTNMNANEVIANRGLEILGHRRGEYEHLHPVDDVNRSQSTNDAYPTAVKIGLDRAVGRLLDQLAGLQRGFADKADEFADLLKVGRTQLQDAVPMTLGQEFRTFAVMIEADRRQLAQARALLHEINLGGTAIGTGLNVLPEYAATVRAHLREVSGIEVETAPDLIAATQDVGCFVQLSGVLKRIAVRLSKISNDLRLLASGPRVGLGEITLPAVQAGSSIMPGKVNPVIPEMMNQIAFQVIGADLTVTMAAEAGQLQLNAFEPVIAHSLFVSLAHLSAGCTTLVDRCIRGITANPEVLRRGMRESIGIVTGLVPYIGYAAASSVATEALAGHLDLGDLVVSRSLLSREQFDGLLADPRQLIGPRLSPTPPSP